MGLPQVWGQVRADVNHAQAQGRTVPDERVSSSRLAQGERSCSRDSAPVPGAVAHCAMSGIWLYFVSHDGLAMKRSQWFGGSQHPVLMDALCNLLLTLPEGVTQSRQFAAPGAGTLGMSLSFRETPRGVPSVYGQEFSLIPR